ncbi:MAG: hypothetical protein ACE5HK_02040 [Candidatus Methylomirabilales bacterium]
MPEPEVLDRIESSTERTPVKEGGEACEEFAVRGGRVHHTMA